MTSSLKMEASSASKTLTVFLTRQFHVPQKRSKNLLSSFVICNIKTQSFYENLKERNFELLLKKYNTSKKSNIKSSENVKCVSLIGHDHEGMESEDQEFEEYLRRNSFEIGSCDNVRSLTVSGTDADKTVEHELQK